MFQDRALRSAWGDKAVATFADHYPQIDFPLRHGLSQHPLLNMYALSNLASQLPAKDVEQRAATTENPDGFSQVDHDPVRASQAIVNMLRTPCWVMLRDIQQNPDYANLLDQIIDPLRTQISAKTGAINMLRGFIFISAPGTLTPLHFDPEFNILMQISGHKTFTTYPALPPYLSAQQQENFHAEGNNILPWGTQYHPAGTPHELDPGDALFVPYKAPHWVKASGNAPSVSLSITWRTHYCDRHDHATQLRSILRRMGFAPNAPATWPASHRSSDLIFRLLRKMGLQ